MDLTEGPTIRIDRSMVYKVIIGIKIKKAPSPSRIIAETLQKFGGVGYGLVTRIVN